MNNDTSHEGVYMFPPPLAHEEDGEGREALVERCARSVISFLTTTFVVETRSIGVDEYHARLFDAASKWLPDEEVATGRQAYVDRMRSLRTGEFSALAEAGSFEAAPVPVGNGWAARITQLRHLRMYASCIAEEADTMEYTSGVLTRDVGASLKAGSLLVRRKSAFATVVYPIVDGDVEFAGQGTAGAEPRVISSILGSLSVLSGVMSAIKPLSTLSDIISNGVNILQLILGLGSESELSTVLAAIPGIVDRELKKASLREKLANLQSFCSRLGQMIHALKNSADQPNYIRGTFLPEVSSLQNVSGTVQNTLHQINVLWEATPLTDGELIEEMLKAFALAITSIMVIHHCKVMSHAALAAAAAPDSDARIKAVNDMRDAFSEYTYAMDVMPLRPQKIVEWHDVYWVKRNDVEQIGWKYDGMSAGLMAHVYHSYWDRLRKDEKLGQFQGPDYTAKRRELRNAAMTKAQPVFDDVPELRRAIAGYESLRKIMQASGTPNPSYPVKPPPFAPER